MSVQGWLQIAVFFAVLTAVTPLIGGYMARVFAGERVLLTPVLGPVEPLLYRVMRTDPAREQDWMLEAIEQRGSRLGVPIDARIERGRDRRHALRETIAHEHYDRIVIAAAGQDSDGFRSEDIAWLLDHAPGELVVVRPARAEPIGAEPIGVQTAADPAQNGSRALVTR